MSGAAALAAGGAGAEQPALLLLLLLVPAGYALAAFRIRRIARAFPLPRGVQAAALLRAAAAACLIAAAAGVWRGVKPVIETRSAQAVSFVIDVSQSMTAEDVAAPGGSLTRLEAARLFAESLLARLDAGTPVSIVAAKGAGALIMPLTCDRPEARAALRALSPRAVSAPGSSIGSGIRAAAAAFPADGDYRAALVVFTDGDETDGAMAQAVREAAEAGVSVYMAGFGGAEETEITAGDGATRVKTALREDALKACAEAAAARARGFPGIPLGETRYFNGAERGAGARLAEALKAGEKKKETAVLVRAEKRGIFTALALACFAASLAAGAPGRKKQ